MKGFENTVARNVAESSLAAKRDVDEFGLRLKGLNNNHSKRFADADCCVCVSESKEREAREEKEWPRRARSQEDMKP